MFLSLSPDQARSNHAGIVTGATGFIRYSVVKELTGAAHQVTGLARSEASASKLSAAGAKVLRGDVEDIECRRRGAAAADGVVHTAFYHLLGHIPLETRLRVLLGNREELDDFKA